MNGHLDSGCSSGGASLLSSRKRERPAAAAAAAATAAPAASSSAARPPPAKRAASASAVLGAGAAPRAPAAASASRATGGKRRAPLSERMRPVSLDGAGFEGQEDVVGPNGFLTRLVRADRPETIPSMVLYGPPGVGKTTIARMVHRRLAGAGVAAKAHFLALSACTANLARVREALEEAKRMRQYGRRYVLFVDELHRFTKLQQDAFLPPVESGDVILIAATTESPSFSINSALLSRCRVVVLRKLADEEVARVLRRAVSDAAAGLSAGSETRFQATDALLAKVARVADGDARTALNVLEIAADLAASEAGGGGGGNGGSVSIEPRHVLQRAHVAFDRDGEEHYNTISALHKSMRGGDASAAVYWLVRMLEGGERPLYVARRLVRFAAEDVGLADPNALLQATAAFQACHTLGMPECDVVLAQCVAYLARAPKSIAAYRALKTARDAVRQLPNAPVPMHIRNAPTKLMKEMGYGKGYIYTPDNPDAPQHFLPDALRGTEFFVEDEACRRARERQ